MFKLALTFVCGVGAGVLVMDTARAPEKRPIPQQTGISIESGLELPIMKANMTLQHCKTTFKCGPEIRYYAGMVRK